MALNQKYTENTARFTVPEDSYIGKLFSVIDLGEHDTGFTKKDKQGKDTGERIIANQVFLTFELQDVNLEDGRPAVISQTYTASLHDKAKLKTVIHALLGGDAATLAEINTEGRTVGEALTPALGKAALVTITHKTRIKDGTTYANISAISPLPKSMKKSVTGITNPLVSILDVDGATVADLAKVPEFIQKKIANRIKTGTRTTIDDDIQF